MNSNKSKWKLATSIAIPVVAGSILGTIATSSAQKDYKKLKQPTFAPPGWVFPVAWTTLYTTMGIAKYLFDRENKPKMIQKSGDIAYITQLGFNFTWSFLFFRWKLRGPALVDAALLFSSISFTTYYFSKKSTPAAMLMVPYLGWVTFANMLNYSVWQLNKA